MNKSDKKNTAKILNKQVFFKNISNAFGLGFSISLPIAGGTVLGFIIDNQKNSHPRWTLSLLFTGVFIASGAIYNTIKEGRSN